MAEFNPETPQAPNTNWLNYSQGYSANKTIGNLFKGFAEAADAGLQAYDRTKRTDIALAANKGVDSIVATKPSEPVQVPEGLKASLGKLDQYKTAVDQGVMTDLEFKVRLDKTAKEMRRTFGSGYSDLIDNALANAQGVSTANQVRDELLKQVDAENKSSDDMTKRKLSFLTSDAGKYLTNPNVLAGYEAQTGAKFDPNNFNLIAAAMAVNAQQASEHNISVAKARLELSNAEDSATTDQAKRVASLEVAELTQTALNKEAWPRVQAAVAASKDAKGPGGVQVTPEEEGQLRELWNALELETRSKVNAILTDPSQPYATTIVNQKDRDDIANIALGTLQIYKDSLSEGQFGTLNAVTRENAAIKSAAENVLLGDPLIATISASKTLGLNPDDISGALGSMDRPGPDGKPISGKMDYNNRLQKRLFMNFLTNDKKGTVELLSEAEAAGLPVLDTKRALDERIKLVTKSETTPEQAAIMMRNLYADQGSQNFIEEFARTDPSTMFATLYSKQMTDKLYGTEMWGQYISWGTNQFNGIAVPLKSDILGAQVSSDTTFVKWDGKQFTIDGAGAKVLMNSNPLTNPVGYAQNVSEYSTYRNALRAVNQMNAFVSLIDYAVSKDGESVTPYIEQLFDQIPVQDNKKQGNMLTQMKKAILELADKAAKETGEALR